jgi:lipid-binding SYLF domain-containing protein
MRRNKLLTVLLSLAGLLWITALPAWAWSGNDASIAADRADRAAEAFKDLVNSPDRGIPSDLLENARGIAVIPHVVHAGLLLGGSWGKGLMAVREKNGTWGTPVFITLTGGSFGPQIGAEATDVVLIFNNRQGIDALLNSKLKLGADASVAAGPIGRTEGAGTDLKLESAMYAYSRAKGLYAGAVLDGAVLSIDKDLDHEIYGPYFSAKDILFRQDVTARWMTTPFINALDRYGPSENKSAEARNAYREPGAMTPSSRD